MYQVSVQCGAHRRMLEAKQGEILLSLLRWAGFVPDAPCGGQGTCGKCKVRIDGETQLACQYRIEQDVCVALPESEEIQALLDNADTHCSARPETDGLLLAVDIGTTTVVCCLMDPSGRELAQAGAVNPQTPWGADVMSRIQAAIHGEEAALTHAVRRGISDLITQVCQMAGVSPKQIGTIAVVGNPCMEQLFLGISPENLAQVPFAPALTEPRVFSAEAYLPLCRGAQLLAAPNISGYIGADTIGCMLSTEFAGRKTPALLVDIGTNGEMVMGNGKRMAACATAAGPALEGANITFGMRATPGAIDHIWLENGEIRISAIGNKTPVGICGSGLIDAAAVLLELGYINARGRIQTVKAFPDAWRLTEVDGQRAVYLTENIYLTQKDIRQVQLAKGAIAAGIQMLTDALDLQPEQLETVFLAGAFGSFIQADSACRIGLLPHQLRHKIRVVGNAAADGAKMMAGSRTLFESTIRLLRQTEVLELAMKAEFQHVFAENMLFPER